MGEPSELTGVVLNDTSARDDFLRQGDPLGQTGCVPRLVAYTT